MPPVDSEEDALIASSSGGGDDDGCPPEADIDPLTIAVVVGLVLLAVVTAIVSRLVYPEGEHGQAFFVFLAIADLVRARLPALWWCGC